MAAKLQKDDSFDLGPPRNARLWQRAKEAAAAAGMAGDFRWVIDWYNRAALVPAYKSEGGERRLRWGKLRLVVERPAGTTHRWKSRDGRSGRHKMLCHYGHIAGTRGADGEAVDFYLHPAPRRGDAYIVHQARVSDPAVYDEDKVMLGFGSQREAEKAYRAHYGVDLLGNVSTVPQRALERRLLGDDTSPMIKARPPRLGLRRAEADPSMVPPRGVRDACRRGLELRGEHGGDGLTSSAVAWAHRMARGEAVSEKKAAKMNAYFARHAVDRKPDWGQGEPTPGYVAWMLWGGDPGRAWAAKLARRLDKANVGRKKPNGRREGCWAYARRVAREKGKGDDYAAAIAHRIMGKAVRSGRLALKSIPSVAGWASGQSPACRLLRPEPELERLTSGDSYVEPPVPMVVDVADAVRDLPLEPERRRRLADKIRIGVHLGRGPKGASGAVAAGLREHGRGLHPALARRLAHRVEYLASKAERPRLSVRKALTDGSTPSRPPPAPGRPALGARGRAVSDG